MRAALSTFESLDGIEKRGNTGIEIATKAPLGHRSAPSQIELNLITSHLVLFDFKRVCIAFNLID